MTYAIVSKCLGNLIQLLLLILFYFLNSASYLILIKKFVIQLLCAIILNFKCIAISLIED